MRFEAGFVALGSILLGAACLLTAFTLDGFGLAGGCIGAWIAGQPDAACASTVEAWAALSADGAGRLLLASGLLPLASGLAAGVVLVGRELETGTAELSWSLARSRSRWLGQRLGVLALFVIGSSVLVAAASARMETAHTAGGLWISPFADADLFGLPVIARSVLALGIGAAGGALVGRTLPAFLVGLLVVAAVVTATSVAQPLFGRLPTTDIGGPGYVAAYLRDSDVEFRFITPDAQLLSKDEALGLVPPGADAADWLQSHMQLLPLGISAAKTFQWQLLTSGIYVAIGGLGLALAALATSVRRPLNG